MSNLHMERYVENKKKISECLERAIQFVDKLGYESRKNALIKQKQDLESGEFTIVVVGEFSAGKSTFLNALMGKKMLPSFTSETTATINFLRHKDRAENGEEGRVYFSDGTQKVLPSADDTTISNYVSTRGNNVAATVHHLDLFKESKFLENNVTLVDSPGLNGVAKGHAEMTKEQIEKSSASIFMFSARQPGSKTDFEVLAELSSKVSSIICVLNQIDAIKTSEGETVDSVIKKLKSNYKDVMGDKAKYIPEIYPMSAFQALMGRDENMLRQNDLGDMEMPTIDERRKYLEKSRILQFEDRLFRYLTQGEKTIAAMETPVKQLEVILSEISDELEQDLEVLNGTVDKTDLEAQIEALEEKKQEMERELREKKKDIKASLDENKKEIIDRMIADADRLSKRLVKDMENWTDAEDIDPANIVKKLEKGVDKIAFEAVDAFAEGNGYIISQYTDTLIDTAAGEGFKFSISGEMDPIKVANIGIQQYKEELERLDSELTALREKADQTNDDFNSRMEQQEKRESLELEIKSKKEMLQSYVETSMAAIPGIRIYIEQVEKEYTIKKRKILPDKIGTRIVDITRKDDSERREFIENRNSAISKREAEIRKLEEELRKIPAGNPKSLNRKTQQIDAAIEAKNQERKRLTEEFKKNSEHKIKSTLEKNKSMIEGYIDDNIDSMKKGFIEYFKKKETTIVGIIMDHVSANVKSKLDSAEERINKMKDEMSQAESDKKAKIDAINENMAELQQISDDVLGVLEILDGIQTDEIETEELDV